MEKWEIFSKEELYNILSNAKSFKAVAKELGYQGCNGVLRNKIRRIAQDLNVQAKYLKRKVNKAEDYIGQTINYLYIQGIDQEKSRNTGITYFDCKCLNCGNEHHSVSINCIKRTKSCGCLRTQRFIEGHYEDLTGQVFQHFKVLSLNKEETIKRDKTYWNCLCLRCNKNIVPVWAWDLKSNHRDNCGCYNRKSKGEEKINILLSKLNFSFVQEYTFPDLYTTKGHCYRFDFAIFEEDKLTCLIEYHGKQHYKDGWKDKEPLEDIQYRDSIKEEYCKKHNIPLIIIPYIDFDLIDTKYLLSKIKEVS